MHSNSVFKQTETPSELTQYINPVIDGKARQALRAHGASGGMDSYKTVMCQTWLETAGCGFGPNCKFAHGEHEIRPCNFPPPTFNLRKYKTKLCDKYTTRGICPYGRRCLFIHPDPLVDEPQRGIQDTTFTQPQPPAVSAMATPSSTTLYRRPTPLFIPPMQQAPPSWPLMRRSSYPCDGYDGGICHGIASAQSRLSIWSSHEDVFTSSAITTMANGQQDTSPSSSNFSNSESVGSACGATIHHHNPSTVDANDNNAKLMIVVKDKTKPKVLKDHGAFNDSCGSLKELRETLAFSLANVLDLSDVHL